MRRIMALLLVSMPVALSPVLAQPVTEYTQTAFTIYNVCMNARDTGSAQEALDACTTVEESLASLRTMVPNASAEETDYVVALQGSVQLGIAAVALILDNDIRTARVCDATERAWQTFADITPGSPTMEGATEVMQGTADNVRICRDAHGAPAWGRPLP